MASLHFINISPARNKPARLKNLTNVFYTVSFAALEAYVGVL